LKSTGGDLAAARSAVSLGATALLLAGALSCRAPAQAPHTAPDFSYLPSSVLLVGYADTVALKESSLYQGWEARMSSERSRLVQAKTFLRRLEIDPEKDLEGIMAACVGVPSQGAWVVLLRGRFDPARIQRALEEPNSRMSVQMHGQWKIYNLMLIPDLGDLSLALVDSSAVVLGQGSALETVLEAREHPETSLARAPFVRKLAPSLDPHSQVWILADGRGLWQSLAQRQDAPGQGAMAPGMENISGILSASLSGFLTSDLSLHLQIGNDSEKHAQNLSDALKGILGFARLGMGTKDKDLGLLVDAIHVDTSKEMIHLRADLPAELAMRLAVRLESGAGVAHQK
jgi:hypothetical protein